MDQQPTLDEIPQYPVRFWEAILIVIGAIALIGTAFIGLGIKVLDNAFNPKRAEAIAQSLMDYQIPGGSRGVFGINIGSAKLATIRSLSDPPEIILFVGKTPTKKESTQSQSEAPGNGQPPGNSTEAFSDDAATAFTVTESRTETKIFCGSPVPITLDQGQQSFGEQAISLPAVRYTVRTTEGSTERLVILTANGKQAQQKAAQVFNSLRCK